MKQRIRLTESGLRNIIKEVINEIQSDFLDRYEFEESIGEYYDFSRMTPEQWRKINEIMRIQLQRNGIDYNNMDEQDYDVFCQLADGAAKEVGVPEYNDLDEAVRRIVRKILR